MSCEKKKSIHGSCTVDDDGYCDECGEEWPCEVDPVLIDGCQEGSDG